MYPLFSGFEALASQPHDQLRQLYSDAHPYPYLIIDGFLPDSEALEFETDCRRAQTLVDSSNDFTQIRKTTLNSWQDMTPRMREVCAFFNSGAFLTFLESITGVKGLISDPFLEGGGLHRTLSGGFLKMHTDFNWSQRLKLYRRINVLYYLNRDYQPGWGGELILQRHLRPHDFDRAVFIQPLFNRLVLFNTNDTTFHGHPVPHQFPISYPRTSLAFYYYTVAPPPWFLRRRYRTSTTRFALLPHEVGAIHKTSIRRRLGYWLRRWSPLG